jgi:hypothetical protein
VERSLFLEKFGKVIELFEKKEGKSIGQYQRFLFRRLTGKEMDEVVGVSAAPPESESADTPDPQAEEKQKAEEARHQAEAEKREEQRMAAELRREEESRKAAAEARNKAEAQKEIEAAKAEEDRKAKEEALRKEEEAKNKPLIRVTPKPRPEPENNPPPAEKEPSLPPWVDPPKEEVKKEEEPPAPVVSVDPPATLPPWIERNQRPTEPNPDIRVVSPAPEENTPPAAEEKQPDVVRETPPEQKTPARETPKTVSEVLREKTKEDKPRSLNDLFSNREKPATILDKSREEQESHHETRVADLGSPRTPEPEKQPPVVHQPPVARTPVTPEPPKTEPPVAESAQPPLMSLLDDQHDTPPAEEKEPEPPRTLADSFQENRDQQGSVNEAHSGKSIKTEQIPVHKQFQFVQRVFGGSSVKFKVVLDKINKTNTVEEAMQVLDKYVYNDPSVNRTDKVAKEFEQLVRARFE